VSAWEELRGLHSVAWELGSSSSSSSSRVTLLPVNELAWEALTGLLQRAKREVVLVMWWVGVGRGVDPWPSRIGSFGSCGEDLVDDCPAGINAQLPYAPPSHEASGHRR
jgi:hypothetical protein